MVSHNGSHLLEEVTSSLMNIELFDPNYLDSLQSSFHCSSESFSTCLATANCVSHNPEIARKNLCLCKVTGRKKYKTEGRNLRYLVNVSRCCEVVLSAYLRSSHLRNKLCKQSLFQKHAIHLSVRTLRNGPLVMQRLSQ